MKKKRVAGWATKMLEEVTSDADDEERGKGGEGKEFGPQKGWKKPRGNANSKTRMKWCSGGASIRRK